MGGAELRGRVNAPRRREPYLIGLTGNIATGKSTVMEVLRKLGAYTIDADKVVHQIMASSASVREAIVGAFGEDVLTPQGEIDRDALGSIVFRDPAALRNLELIVHPIVMQTIDDMIVNAEKDVVVVEAIKLIETKMNRDYDALWVVTSPPEQQIERMVTQRGPSEVEARRRVEAQSPQSSKTALADVIITNNGNLRDLEQQVMTEWNKIRRHLDRTALGVGGSGEPENGSKPRPPS